VRLGYEAEAKHVQDLYLDGKRDEAAAAIPTALVEDLALIGSEFSDVLRRKHPPAFVQAIAFGVLGFIARRRGLKAIYPEYLGPHGSVTPDPAVMAAAGLEPVAR